MRTKLSFAYIGISLILEFHCIKFKSFGNIFAKYRAFGNNIIFLQQISHFWVGECPPPAGGAYTLICHLFVQIQISNPWNSSQHLIRRYLLSEVFSGGAVSTSSRFFFRGFRDFVTHLEFGTCLKILKCLTCILVHLQLNS